MPLHDAFVAAFNAADLDAMAGLLAPDATAQVLGAPFPEERGADMIRRTSFPHIADPAMRLSASRVTVADQEWVVLRDEAGRIDTAISLHLADGAISRVEYVVGPQRPDQLRSLGAAAGLPTVAD